MNRRKRQSLDSYEQTEDGSFAYRGTLWQWESRERREAFLRRAGLLAAGVLALLVGAGFVPLQTRGSAFVVLVPYALCWVGTALASSTLLSLFREGEQLRDHVHQRVSQNLGPQLLAGMVMAFASAVGALINIALGHAGPLTGLFGALMLGAGLLLGRLHRLAEGLSFLKKA